jgi:2-keto-3-deoxy-L-rhamnonate aldolase RhmA
MAAIAEAAKRHGKIACGVVRTLAELKHMLELGYQLITCTADARLLANYSKTEVRNCRAVLDDNASSNSADPASLY